MPKLRAIVEACGRTYPGLREECQEYCDEHLLGEPFTDDEKTLDLIAEDLLVRFQYSIHLETMGAENLTVFVRPERSPMTNREKMIRELCTITTRNDAGRHFTEYSKWWRDLEHQKLIEISRPVHEQTGIPYSQEHWGLRVTGLGQEEVDSFVEMHPELFS